MACRKSAYDAQVAMSEYMEKQQEKAAQRRGQLEARARQIWTPTQVLDACCIPWLYHGAEVTGHGGDRFGSAVALARGCSGGCGKSHPRITLTFPSSSSADEGGGSMAVLSHAFDPFVKYFEDLCQEGRATRGTIILTAGTSSSRVQPQSRNVSGPIVYNLAGFLESHVDQLRKTPTFGFHLVEVSAMSLAASRRAHEHQLEAEEEEQRRAKRQKILVDTKNGKGSAGNGDKLSFLDNVLQTCYQNASLKEHLTFSEISWMRLSGHKTMASVAAGLASQRMRDVRLSFSVLVDPLPPEILGHIGKPHEGRLTLQKFLSTSLFQQYVVAGFHLPLVASSRNPEKFIPKAGNSPNVFHWTNIEHDEKQPHTRRSRDKAIVRVYLEQISAHTALGGKIVLKAPENDCLGRTLPLEITRFQIDAHVEREEGIYKTPCSRLTYKVLPGGITASGGRISIESIDVSFAELLGIYARKKLPFAKQDMQDAKRKQPVKRAEKEYVKGIARQAREMPRSQEHFLSGW